MDLSNDLISKFVKITNDADKQKSKEGTVYGTAVKYNGGIYVRIDGSDLLTPIDTTADIKEGERVTITIKDHNATVTGNITSPSASSVDVKKVTKNVEEIEGEITEFEAVIADVVHVGELDAEVARIDELLAGKATIEDLTVTNAEITNLKAKDAEIENLVADKATIEDLTATNAEITNLKANKADITYLDANFATIDQLEATHANIDVLDAEVANINTLVNGNLTSDNILSFNITSKNTTMEDAFIKDAMIDRITANKIMSGIIDTNNVVIQSTDGSMLLQGNILQMKDESGKVRIQIGKDTGGNFTFVLYDESGKGVLIDEEGIKSSDAIADGLIVDAKVADNANISGAKLDIASVITEVNKDNSTTIKSSKIYLNEQNQSLEVAFNSLKTQVEAIQDVTIDGDLSSIVEQVQSNTTQINANKEGINTLVAENVIRTEEISDLEGELQQVNTTLSNKYTSLEQNINGFKTTVNDTYTTKTELAAVDGKFANYSTTSAMNSAINQKANEITSSVSSTYATKSSVDGLSSVYATKSELTQTNNSITAKFSESGGYNRVRNGAFLTGDLTHWTDWGTCTRVVENSTDSGLGKVVKITTTSVNQGIQQIITGLVAGKKYILSALVWASSGQGVIQVNNNGTYLSAATKSAGKFEHLSASFTASSSSVTVQLGRSGGGSNGTYYFTGILLTEGETKLLWSPHPSEVYDGITKIDKDGVKVSQSNYNGYTQMKADGFYVNNGSENVISITKDGSYFKGKVVVTSGSTVPTSVLSGTISSSQLNSTITSDISTAKTNASTAVSTANTASTNASNAVKTANTASTNASNAVSTANTAKTNASTAVSTANTASTNASNAVKTANTASTNASNAVSTANTASTNASNAVKTANTASTNASNAVTTANTAKSTADTAKSTADSVKSTVDSGKTNWNNAYNRVNEWAYGAVTGSTTIDGGYIQANTIVADKIAVVDFTNYADLNANTLSSWGWSSVADSSASNNPWFQVKTISRDKRISKWYRCNGGEVFRIKADIFTSVYARPNSDGTGTATAKGVCIAIFTRNADGSAGYHTGSRITAASTSGTTGTVNYTITIPSTAREFAVFVQIDGWPTFSGILRVRNVLVNKMSSGELIVDGAITAAKIASRTITADRIATGVITANEIAANAITAAKIAAGAITADKLAANAITSKTITGSTITGGTINGATITSETLMKSYGGVYVGSELWGGFKKDSNGNYSSAQTFTIHGSTALQIDGNPTRISSVTGEVKIGDASSYNNLRAKCLYAQEIVYTDDIRSRTTGNALLMENISMRSANAYVQFTSGYGVIRIKERNHLYLQTGGNTGGDTSAEIRCTRYSDTSNYVNIRAHNVCAQNAVYAAGVNVSSDRARKRDIELYSTDALQEVCSTPVYAYHLDTDKDEELKRIGIIMQEAPLDAIDLTGKGVDLYQMVTMLWKATQQQQEMIEELKQQLKGE